MLVSPSGLTTWASAKVANSGLWAFVIASASLPSLPSLALLAEEVQVGPVNAPVPVPQAVRRGHDGVLRHR